MVGFVVVESVAIVGPQVVDVSSITVSCHTSHLYLTAVTSDHPILYHWLLGDYVSVLHRPIPHCVDTGRDHRDRLEKRTVHTQMVESHSGMHHETQTITPRRCHGRSTVSCQLSAVGDTHNYIVPSRVIVSPLQQQNALSTTAVQCSPSIALRALTPRYPLLSLVLLHWV